ncbi:MAG: Sec-independent protein translocase subunit TatA/TatB [Candidatus Fervidibacter sp.]|uniref:Sec-independent protein translocase subunit TatA/TatB n=1 Tax=Candidatus Fervidibacter sp. TaxID=3100871 RepID=UPI00404A4F49
MFGLSPQELIVIAVIVVLLFGAKKVPEFFSSLGKGLKEFKKAMREEEPEERKKPQESETE